MVKVEGEFATLPCDRCTLQECHLGNLAILSEAFFSKYYISSLDSGDLWPLSGWKNERVLERYVTPFPLAHSSSSSSGAAEAALRVAVRIDTNAGRAPWRLVNELVFTHPSDQIGARMRCHTQEHVTFGAYVSAQCHSRWYGGR